MFTFYTTFLSKSDFSFALLLVTFEPLDIQQSYIPLLKALKCGINAVGAQGRGCSSLLCHAHLKMGVLLHKQANGRFILILAVLAVDKNASEVISWLPDRTPAFYMRRYSTPICKQDLS